MLAVKNNLRCHFCFKTEEEEAGQTGVSECRPKNESNKQVFGRNRANKRTFWVHVCAQSDEPNPKGMKLKKSRARVIPSERERER
jgi:hypothetical protein